MNLSNALLDESAYACIRRRILRGELLMQQYSPVLFVQDRISHFSFHSSCSLKKDVILPVLEALFKTRDSFWSEFLDICIGVWQADPSILVLSPTVE